MNALLGPGYKVVVTIPLYKWESIARSAKWRIVCMCLASDLMGWRQTCMSFLYRKVDQELAAIKLYANNFLDAKSTRGHRVYQPSKYSGYRIRLFHPGEYAFSLRSWIECLARQDFRGCQLCVMFSVFLPTHKLSSQPSVQRIQHFTASSHQERVRCQT